MKKAYVYAVVLLLLIMITGCPAFWKSADATLKKLMYNGVEVPEFSAKKTSYSVVLPAGTTEPPTVAAVPAVEGVYIVITDAETLPGTATVLVTSLNGKESLTYSIFFTVKVVISITADPPNGGEFSGDGEYVYGDLVTIVATPSIHHTFNGWYLDEPEEECFEESGDDPIYTEPVASFQALKDVSLWVGFSPMEYTFNLVPVPPEGGEVAGGGAVNYGDSVDLSALSNDGYGFAGWWIDGYMFSDQAADLVSTVEILSHTECITCTEYTIEGRFDPSSPQWQLDVTIEATPVKGGETWGEGVYPYGSFVTVGATPSEHFNFDGWYVGGEELSQGATYTFPANDYYTEGVTYTALPLLGAFADIIYSFNAVAEPPEGGTVSGGGTAKYGQNVSFLAEPNESYTFEGWYYGEENMSGSPSFTLDTASFLDTHTIPVTSTENSFTFTAKFQTQPPPPGWLLITIDASPTDKGEFSGAGKYPYGEDVTLGATPIDHYDFGGWYTDGEMLSDDLPYTFNTSEWLPTQGATDTLPIIAWFPPIEYQFNAVAEPPEGGTVSGGGTAKYGQNVSFLAVPNESYTFEGWYYGEENMSGSPSFTLDTASFLDTHTLPVTSTENSFTFTAKFQTQPPPPGWLLITIDASPTDKGEFSGAGKYPYGEDVTLGATPIDHYDFGGWYTDGEMLSDDLPYTFNTSDWLPTQGVTDTLPIVAWFPPVFYQFNVVANPPEGGEVTGSGVFIHGDPMVLGAVPSDNYVFKSWTFEGAEFSYNPLWEGDATFFLVRSVCIGCTEFTIIGNFDLDVPDTVTVDLRAEPTDGGQVSGGGQFPKGSSTVIRALPNPGYEFGGWYYESCGSFFDGYPTITLSNLQFDLALFASFYKP